MTPLQTAALTGTLASCLALGACAGGPPAGPALAAGAASLDAAHAAGAPTLAPAEYDAASTRLAHALALARAGDRQAAWRQAEQARADAVLAQARAEAERARQAAAVVQANLDALRSAAGRFAPGVRPPPPSPDPTPSPAPALPPGR